MTTKTKLIIGAVVTLGLVAAGAALCFKFKDKITLTKYLNGQGVSSAVS